MPYIDDDAKTRINYEGVRPQTAGELTYCINKAIQDYLEENRAADNKMKYEHLAGALGALEGAKLDLIQRIIKPYEKNKLADNGDVWNEDLLIAAENGG